LKDLFNRLGGRRLFILAAALGLFLVAFVLNKYLIGAASSPFYAERIQKDIMAKERSFQRIAHDTALLISLINRDYGERTLNRVSAQKTGFFFFIYAKDTSTVGEHKLLFWNTQQALPPMNIMNENMASRLVRLSNGLYVHTSLSIELPGGKQYALESLLPVMWRYFVENENLQKEFVSFPEAGKRVDISFKPTQFPVKSSYGNILFYIDKITVHEQQTSWWTILIALAGVFLLFIYIHQTAEVVYRRYGLFAGIGFLFIVIGVIRY